MCYSRYVLSLFKKKRWNETSVMAQRNNISRLFFFPTHTLNGGDAYFIEDGVGGGSAWKLRDEGVGEGMEKEGEERVFGSGFCSSSPPRHPEDR